MEGLRVMEGCRVATGSDEERGGSSTAAGRRSTHYRAPVGTAGKDAARMNPPVALVVVLAK